MTTPVLVHLPGLFGKDWSCTTTVSPTWSAGRSLAPSESRSSILACRFAWACSRRSASSLHSFRGWYLVMMDGRKPFSSLPNMIMAGLSWVRGSTVLRCSSRARAKESVLRVPLGPRLPITRRLAALTATSALLLARG